MPKSYARVLLVFLASVCLIRQSQSANVLCMFTSSAKTQIITFMAVANTLIERGHNVTVVTTIPIPPQSLSKKPFRHVWLEQPAQTMQQLNEHLADMVDELVPKYRVMIHFTRIVQMFTTIQVNALKRVEFQTFFEEDNHFDLMLLGYFHNDYMVGVAARYKCPIAIICLGSPYGPISRMIGNPEETSYVQFPLFGRSQPMSFVERIVNFLWALAEPYIQDYATLVMENYYKTLFTGDSYPEYSEAITNISLVLCNNHFTELPIRPLVPAVVEIGGIQFKDQPDPLTEDIRAFLDSSPNTTILFSVGSKSRPTPLKPEKVKIILNVLSKLNQTVLWDWDRTEEPPKTYPNILFKRSLPFDDILFQPNVSLFITDGRPNVILGAASRGVPMLGIPLYADEPYNVLEMTNQGFGVSLDASNFTEDSLKEALRLVLENPKYAEKVKYFAKKYSDRPITAKETAAFWLEYVIRHRGAPHMQSPLVRMSFVQRWNIDVIAVIVALICAFLLLVKLVAALVRLCLQYKVWAVQRSGKYKQF